MRQFAFAPPLERLGCHALTLEQFLCHIPAHLHARIIQARAQHQHDRLVPYGLGNAQAYYGVVVEFRQGLKERPVLAVLIELGLSAVGNGRQEPRSINHRQPAHEPLCQRLGRVARRWHMRFDFRLSLLHHPDRFL